MKSDETTGHHHEGLSVEAVAEAVAMLITERVCPGQGSKGAVLVGYSMGARVALRAAASHPSAAAVAAIGGSGGIRGDVQRKMRADRDDAMAAALGVASRRSRARGTARACSARSLAPGWRRRHCGRDAKSNFESIEFGTRRARRGRRRGDLARVLAAMSPGRQAVVTGDDLARSTAGPSEV